MTGFQNANPIYQATKAQIGKTRCSLAPFLLESAVVVVFSKEKKKCVVAMEEAVNLLYRFLELFAVHEGKLQVAWSLSVDDRSVPLSATHRNLHSLALDPYDVKKSTSRTW